MDLDDPNVVAEQELLNAAAAIDAAAGKLATLQPKVAVARGRNEGQLINICMYACISLNAKYICIYIYVCICLYVYKYSFYY